MLTKIVSSSLKTAESYKTRQDAFDKTYEYFLGNSLRVLRQFSENLKMHRKSWENGFGLIYEK